MHHLITFSILDDTVNKIIYGSVRNNNNTNGGTTVYELKDDFSDFKPVAKYQHDWITSAAYDNKGTVYWTGKLHRLEQIDFEVFFSQPDFKEHCTAKVTSCSAPHQNLKASSTIKSLLQTMSY